MRVLLCVILLICNCYATNIDKQTFQLFCTQNSAFFEPIFFYEEKDFLCIPLCTLEKESYFQWLCDIVKVSNDCIKKLKKFEKCYTGNTKYIKEYILLKSDIDGCIYRQRVSFQYLSVFLNITQKNILSYFERDVTKYNILSLNRSLEILEMIEPFGPKEKEQRDRLKKCYVSVVQNILQKKLVTSDDL